MLQMAGNTVRSKEKLINRPRVFFLFFLFFQRLLSRTRTRLPIVSTVRLGLPLLFSLLQTDRLAPYCYYPFFCPLDHLALGPVVALYATGIFARVQWYLTSGASPFRQALPPLALIPVSLGSPPSPATHFRSAGFDSNLVP